MRHAALRDATEKPGLKELRRHQHVVGIERLSAPGWPDTLVYVRGAGALWVEWKSPGGELERLQVEWWQRHEAAGCVGIVVSSGAEAVAAVLAFRASQSLVPWSWRKWAPKGTPSPNVGGTR